MKKVIMIVICLLFSLISNAQLSQNGLLFDGVDDRVVVPHNAAYNIGTGDLTIEAWIRADALAGSSIWETVLTQHQSGNTSGISFGLAYNGRMFFTINGSGYGPGTSPSLRDGICHHIAVVRKDTLLTYYIDGAPIAGNPTSTTAIVSTSPLIIGAYNSVPPSNQTAFKGLIKEVRYWNVARTNTQLLTYLNTPPAGNSAGLIGYWRLNASSGQVVSDASLTANNGTLGYTSSVEVYDPAFSTGCPSCTQPTAVITAGGPLNFCIGDSVLLSATSGAGNTYQWYKNGTAIVGAVSNTYYAKLSGAYSVKITNSLGCSSYSNALDVVQLLDNVGGITCSGITVGAWACLNGGNSRTLSIGTGAGYSYQWKRDNVNIVGNNSPTFTTTLAG